MTFLLTVLLLLVGGGTAGAIDQSPLYMRKIIHPPGVVTTEVSTDQQEWIAVASSLIEPDPCLAKLKAAMKAMEPYITSFYLGATLGSLDTRSGRTHFSNIEADKVLQQWNIAKRECWSKPSP